MKKLLGLILLALVYVGISYYAGIVGEQSIREQVALSQAQAEAQSVTLELTDYERGVFSSEFQFSARSMAGGEEIGAIIVSAHTRVSHGPVILADGPKFGWFYARSAAKIRAEKDELNATLDKALPKGLGRATVLGDFSGGYKATWRTETVDYQDDTNRFTIDGIDVTARGRLNETSAHSEFATGQITAELEEGATFTMTPVTGEADVRVLDSGLALSDSQFGSDKATLTTPDSPPMTLEQLAYDQTQKRVNERIDTQVRLTAKRMNAGMEITDLYYELALKQVKPEAMLAWSKLSPKLQENADWSAHQAELYDALDKLLHEDLKLDFSMGAKLAGGYTKTDISAHYVPPTGGRELAELSQAEYYNLVGATADMRVSQQVMQSTGMTMMLAPYIGTYITQEGDEYVLNARLQNGVVTIAGQEFVLANLLGAVGAGAAQ